MNSGFDTQHFRQGLAPYASLAEETRGRLFPETVSPTRTPFQRDRDRIIHSTAFRRLKHKTQVFVSHEGDHYRTRLTHSIEVSQISRSIARSLRLDEDLAESLALVHDFGHTPFGHAGERALMRKMADHGGFEHNAQALRIVTELERRYMGYDGLNLSWEVLEGLIKHNGPLLGPNARKDEAVPQAVLDFCKLQDLELETFSSLEAQAAAISDDIAYNSADLDDGLRAGLFTLDDLRDAGLAGRILGQIDREHLNAEDMRRGAELVRRVITVLVEDAIFEAQKNLSELSPNTAADVRAAGQTIIAFSPSMEAELTGLRKFLFANMYRHPKVMEVMEPAENSIERLFDHYCIHPDELSSRRFGLVKANEASLHRVVSDYISGMTDDFAQKEAARLLD